MCIFSQPVESVTNTKIFARLQDGDWQHLVYQMSFASQRDNAIILPLPVQPGFGEADSLKFVSLKDYEGFFSDLQRGFPIVLPDSPSRGRSFSNQLDVPRLAVHEVGDFVASFVPTQKDFDRLDAQFRIPQSSWDLIPRYADYAFAVFQLKSKAGKPHPMAFRFRSRLAQDRSVFFPTVHIHDGQVHEREGFDHVLYLQSSEFDAICGEYIKRGYHVTDRQTGYVRSAGPARDFCRIDRTYGIVAGDQLVHRLEKKGRFRNDDIIARLSRSRAASAPEAFGVMGVTAIAGVMGLKWICDRRDLMAEAQER
ncbi:MAG: hypothetical protein NXI04_10710 [Planctomycetaceae bacterium]|nr:hypothetical protein [Planctomycetaceae bacterium]